MKTKVKIWTAVAVSMVFVFALWAYQLKLNLGAQTLKDDFAELNAETEKAKAEWQSLWQSIAPSFEPFEEIQANSESEPQSDGVKALETDAIMRVKTKLTEEGYGQEN